MKLSIIMPLYNMGDKVERTLKHLACQTLYDTEVIIINDGSTDNTGEIVEKYSDKLPIVLINLSDRVSVGCARNIGIKRASGAYLVFCDGDDLIFLDKVYDVIKEMDIYRVSMSIVSYQDYDWLNDTVFDKTKGIRWDIVGDKKIINVKEYLPDIFQLTNITCWNKIYKSDFLKNEKITFPDTNYLEDLVFVYEYILKAAKVLISKEICYRYSIPMPGRCSMLNSMENYLDEYLNTLDLMNKKLSLYFENSDRNEIEKISKSAIFEYIRLISFAVKNAKGNWNSALDSKAFEIICELQEKSKKR